MATERKWVKEKAYRTQDKILEWGSQSYYLPPPDAWENANGEIISWAKENFNCSLMSSDPNDFLSKVFPSETPWGSLVILGSHLHYSSQYLGIPHQWQCSHILVLLTSWNMTKRAPSLIPLQDFQWTLPQTPDPESQLPEGRQWSLHQPKPGQPRPCRPAHVTKVPLEEWELHASHEHHQPGEHRVCGPLPA